jgi:hypothetical protein
VPEGREVQAAPSRYVLIGLGGIGGLVLRLLVPFLHGSGERATVLAADGDSFEERNRSRMLFERLGPKALVLCEELGASYGDRVTLLPVPEYLTPQRARSWIREGDVVFCMPDNHATRRVAERRCARLRDVALFCSRDDGIENERSGTYGSVAIYLRAGGRDLTNPPSAHHPEIARPSDPLPTRQGCSAAMASAPQLLFTNAAVAAATLGAFYSWRAGTLDYEETCLDIAAGQSRAIRRPLRSGGRRPQSAMARTGERP